MTNPWKRKEVIGDCTLYLGAAEPGEVWPLIRDNHYSGRMPGNEAWRYVYLDWTDCFRQTIITV